MATLTARIEQAIVDRLKLEISVVHADDIHAVRDADTMMNIGGLTPPCILVVYDSESAIDVTSGGPESASRLGIGSQFWRTDFNFDVYVIAKSFSADGGGRLDDLDAYQEVGAYTLIDNVFEALAGSQLPVDGTESLVAMFPRGVEPYGIDELHVVYRTRWHCPATRVGAAAGG